MIHIEPLVQGNPFETYPKLLTIWPEPSNSTMHEITLFTISVIEQAPELDIGGLYLIYKNDEVIGLTGFFIDEPDEYIRPYAAHKDLSTLYLRWTGVIPEYRGLGYSSEAFDLVLREAAKRYPKLDTMIELIPQTSYNQPIERYFTSLGFKPVGESEQYDWSPHKWQPYHLDTKAYLLQHQKNEITVKKMKF